MHAAHHCTLTCEDAPVCYACGGGALVAVRGSGGRCVRLWDMEELEEEPLLLAIASPIEALALGPAVRDDGSVLLAAASSCCLHVWDLCRGLGRGAAVVSGPSAVDLSATAASAAAGEVRSAAIDAESRHLVLLAAAEAWVFDVCSPDPQLLLRLIGHAAALSACDFGAGLAVRTAAASPGMRALDGPVLLTAAEDRCFKLWELAPEPQFAEPRALLQSALPPGGAPILAAALHPEGAAQLLVGDAAGLVRCYELFDAPSSAPLLTCTCSQTIDLQRWVDRAHRMHAQPPPAAVAAGGPRLVSTLPAWQKGPQAAVAEAPPPPEAAEAGIAVLHLGYILLPQRAAEQLVEGGGGGGEYGVLVSAPSQTLVLRCGSWECEPLETGGDADEVAASASGCGAAGCGLRWLVRASAFQPGARVWRLDLDDEPHISDDLDAISDRLATMSPRDEPPPPGGDAGLPAESVARSVLPTRPPLRDSPLGRALAAAAEPPPAAAKPGKGAKKGPPADQPVTFNRRVASSGYGQPQGLTGTVEVERDVCTGYTIY